MGRVVQWVREGAGEPEEGRTEVQFPRVLAGRCIMARVPWSRREALSSWRQCFQQAGVVSNAVRALVAYAKTLRLVCCLVLNVSSVRLACAVCVISRPRLRRGSSFIHPPVVD